LYIGAAVDFCHISVGWRRGVLVCGYAAIDADSIRGGELGKLQDQIPGEVLSIFD